ncbi:MAG TPA: hypothetical protein VGA59_02825 [Ramlibacter sp.]
MPPALLAPGLGVLWSGLAGPRLQQGFALLSMGVACALLARIAV